MSGKRGASRPVSTARRIVLDLLHFSTCVPQIPMERVMRLAPLVAARERASSRVGWCALFTKAFALVAVQRPELRDVFLDYPWRRIFRYDSSVAAIIVERQLEGENALLPLRLEQPEQRPLTDIEAIIQKGKLASLKEIPSFRRTLRLAKYPRFLRRGLMWLAYRWSGGWHNRHIGNFGVSVVAGSGAGQLALLSPTTATIHYGVFAEDGSLPVRVSFDHRVIDGADMARAMAELENVLLTTILEELQADAGRLAA